MVALSAVLHTDQQFMNCWEGASVAVHLAVYVPEAASLTMCWISNHAESTTSLSVGNDAPPGRVEAAYGQLRQAAVLRRAVPMRYTDQSIWTHLQLKYHML